MCVLDRRLSFELRHVVRVPSWCTAFSSTPSGLATYCSLVDSLSLHVRLSLSARRDLQYNCSSALRELAICMYMYVWARYHAVVNLAHVQSNPFYHPFYPDVTHVRKDTRPSPAFPYCKRRKAEWGLGTRLSPMTITKFTCGVYRVYQPWLLFEGAIYFTQSFQLCSYYSKAIAI